MEMRVECIRFKSCPKGVLLGFCDIKILDFGLTIFGITVNMKNGKKWCNMPAKDILQPDGAKKYISHLRFDTMEQMNEFSHLVEKAIDIYCEAESKKNDFPPIDEECPF